MKRKDYNSHKGTGVTSGKRELNQNLDSLSRNVNTHQSQAEF